MDVSAIANLATSMSQAQTASDVSVAVFKKSLDAQASVAMGLINAIPQPANLPAHLGQNFNTTA